ncbi:MAG: hypothetical protein KDB35_05060 [Acidimicrobiales bacterium]|nr:hypothetical protein [Acidimicrobiales bacterium]MCB1016418.1 hypothetical protein [Acidimicrobiales bacterium]MCB9372482.1 aerial mycelium formation protein [Microthrixaceae bacterium]
MATLAEVLDPGYVSDLGDQGLDEVRARRDEAQRVENGVSYLRRLAQGQLDIVEHERTRRREGGDAGDLADLIGRLPDILAEHGRAPGPGRPPQDLDPAVVPDELQAELDAIVADADLADVATLGDAELDALAERLRGFEATVSGRRQALHACIDTLQDEIKRRYREGEADVDSLLT